MVVRNWQWFMSSFQVSGTVLEIEPCQGKHTLSKRAHWCLQVDVNHRHEDLTEEGFTWYQHPVNLIEDIHVRSPAPCAKHKTPLSSKISTKIHPKSPPETKNTKIDENTRFCIAFVFFRFGVFGRRFGVYFGTGRRRLQTCCEDGNIVAIACYRSLLFPSDTPRDTPWNTLNFGDTLSDIPGDTRAWRARKTPVASRWARNNLLCNWEEKKTHKHKFCSGEGPSRLAGQKSWCVLPEPRKTSTFFWLTGCWLLVPAPKSLHK